MHMKLSMLWFALQGYHQDTARETRVRALVRDMIDLFGCDRCMFASNYPVDRISDIPISDLYRQFLAWTTDLSEADRTRLFHGTAVRVYGLSDE